MTETIAEIAEREALEAETDDDAETEPDEPETESQPDEPETEDEPAPPPPSDAEMEKAFTKLEQAAGRYTKAAGAILEAHDLGLAPCPLCTIPGLVFPYQGDASDDVNTRTIVEAYFGQTKEPLKADPAYVICEACDGYGWRVTPSRVEGNRKIMCSVCSGQGHREQAAINAQATVDSFAAHTLTTPSGDTYVPAAMDEWGRPAGHPHFGMHPATL